MCDSPVCGHRFRSCHTVYFILYMVDIGYWTTPSFVEPLLLANLAWRARSWCRRTSVRPPDDIEKSIAHRLHCAMPLSGNFAIQTPPILACIFSSAPFFQRGLRHLLSREYGKQRAHPKNAGDYPMRIHRPWHVTVAAVCEHSAVTD